MTDKPSLRQTVARFYPTGSPVTQAQFEAAWSTYNRTSDRIAALNDELRKLKLEQADAKAIVDRGMAEQHARDNET